MLANDGLPLTIPLGCFLAIGLPLWGLATVFYLRTLPPRADRPDPNTPRDDPWGWLGVVVFGVPAFGVTLCCGAYAFG